MDLKYFLPSKLFEVIERAGISSPSQILILSVWDIKKLTNLCTDDIALLKNLVSEHIAPPVVTCDTLKLKENQIKVTTGCDAIDKVLRGGFRIGTLTEVYGESGTGKTQVALQATAHNWASGTVFICTEDQFPIKRFEQIKASISGYCSSDDYGKNTFVEHVIEANDLLSCVRVRLPHLLEKHNLSLIVVDSIAGSFRSEYTNYTQRAEELRELAVDLIRLSQKYNLAVLCINQVTSTFDDTDNVVPTLGLAWSNMISTRLWLRKTSTVIDIKPLPISTCAKVPRIARSVHVRELSVIFAPDLPPTSVKLIITPTGLQCIE